MPSILSQQYSFPISVTKSISYPETIPRFPSASVKASNSSTSSSILLAARLLNSETVPSPGPEGASGNAFLLLDFPNGNIKIYIADLNLPGDPPSYAKIGYGGSGQEGTEYLSLLCANTFLSQSAYGYAFAATLPCDLSLLEAMADRASEFYLSVTTDDMPAGAVRGQLMTPQDTAASLPGILLPPQLVGNSSTNGSLGSILSTSVTYTTVTYSAGTADSSVTSDWAYLNLTVAALSLGNSIPAAMNVLAGESADVATAAASSAATSSACAEDGEDCAAATASASSAAIAIPHTMFSNFVKTILPALPALTSNLPSLRSGQFVEAGMSALLATVMAFVEAAPSADSSKVLSALTSALNASLAIQP